MAYECPHCGEKVQRKMSSGTVAATGGGLVGALLAMAFGSYTCRNCGDLKRSEFPPAARRSMMLGSMGLIVAALVILIAVIALLVNLNN